jgi:hypothetical protein
VQQGRSAPFTASAAYALQFSSGAKQVAIAAPVVIDEAGATAMAALAAAKSRAENTLSGKHTILINY